ncbi:CHAT domain-containing protein [Tenacibaculum sp. MAR_2010_89]|uniref:CHAT domain-containing protein n=1 Tax=Tenacibaculum sp. MAR_2010_89 TaxID=1250198 RepID=UPI00089C1D30|nr:CHAT domain-containing protein [Tenacibaculum sp. MAR_2010_89]SED63499.1 CHAT domain-containing protein [Tenacibaculum sp. MAR_2010_89]
MLFKTNTYRIQLFIVTLLFFLQTVNAQYAYTDIIEKSKSINFTEKKVDSILDSIMIKDIEYAKIAHNFSFFFNKKKKNYELAIKYGKIEVKIYDSLKINNKQYTNALYNLGKFHTKINDFDNGIKYHKKAIQSNSYPLRKAQSYCYIGSIYFKKGEYYKSNNHYLKGIPLLEKYSTKKNLIGHCIDFTTTCIKINTKKSIEIGLFYLKKADSLAQNSPTLNIDNRTIYTINVAIANLYSLKPKHNFRKSKSYYFKSLQNAYKENNDDYISLSYLNLGELYLKANNDSCMFYLNKSIKHNFMNKNYMLYIHKNIATHYYSRKEYKNTLIHIKKSLNHGFNVKKNKEITSLTLNQIITTNDKTPLIRALKIKTETLLNLYNTKQEKEYLQKAIDNVQLTNKIISIIINYSTEANTKYLWRKEISETFNLGIYSAYLLNDSKLMFELMEKNKAFLLALNINENIKLTNLPDEVSRKNNLFKKNIFQLESETEIHKASKKKDSLFDLKVSYQNFKDSIQKIYPQFSNQNNNIKHVSFNQVKSNLHKNDIKLYYTLNTSNVDANKQSMLGLLIAKNKDIHFKIKNIDSVLLYITEYKKLISKPLTQKQELARFKKVSYSLYNQLFPNKETKEIIKNKNISIVTDVSLENIPFEAFNTSSTGLQYLVNDCNISYSYSSSFSGFNKNRVRKTNKDIVVFAPVNFKNTELSSLKNTEKEAAVITNLVGGDSFTNSNATKENFVRKTSNAKIIHLATHATATSNPSIQFFTNDLKLHELYTYKNNADLVVLSACETNIGELKQGEGVLNLARGFFHSGANAVVSSTWKINDVSSSFIMKEFYTNLRNKQSKTEALNNAKRAYLKNHSLSEQSPYYWASFVLIGDTSPVFTTNYFYYIGIVLIIGLLVFFYFKRK